MNLENKLREQLSTPIQVGRPIQVVDAESGWTVQLSVDRNDALSCLAQEMTFHRVTPAATDVRAWAATLAQRVRGLMEPLVVHEVDVTRGQAILRSEKPAVRNEVRSYFELTLDGTRSATLRRYQVSGTAKRQQTGFALTHEGLFQLVDNVTSR